MGGLCQWPRMNPDKNVGSDWIITYPIKPNIIFGIYEGMEHNIASHGVYDVSTNTFHVYTRDETGNANRYGYTLVINI